MDHGASKGGSMRLWGWIPEGTRDWVESYSQMWLCVDCNTCTLEAEAGKLHYWGHPRLYSKILYQNQIDKQTNTPTRQLVSPQKGISIQYWGKHPVWPAAVMITSISLHLTIMMWRFSVKSYHFFCPFFKLLNELPFPCIYSFHSHLVSYVCGKESIFICNLFFSFFVVSQWTEFLIWLKNTYDQ